MARFSYLADVLRRKKLVLGILVVSVVAYAGQNIDNLRISGNTISTLNTNGDLTLDMNGTGSVIFNDLTASTVPYLDASKQLTSSAVTNTELGYLSGVTSAIQTQLGTKITDPMTTNGDLITRTAGVPARLAIGAENTVLQSSGSAPQWANTLAGLTLTSPVVNSGTLNTPTTDIVLWDDTTTPANPSAGFYKLYFKNDGKVYKLNSSGVEAEVGSGSGGGSSGINMLSAANHNAELGATTFWSESGGGTLTTTSTAANVANGTYAFSFDASADTDYAISDAVNVPAGLFGANCLLQFYYKGFDSNITAQVHDGTNVLVSQALTAASAYTTANLNFVCPSSGTLQMRLLAGADAAIGYWDEVHLGSALNLTNVSQASFIGQAYFATTAGCTFTRTNTVLGALADTDCPGPTVEANPGPGTIQTTDADAPIVTLNNLPPGRYMVGFVGASGTSATPSFAAASISDGTTQSGQAGINIHASVIAPFHLTGTFVYTTSGNRSFELFVSSSANAVNVHNSASDQRLYFYIYRFPSSSQLAVNTDQQFKQFWGYHDGTCTWTRTNTAYDDPAADSSCAFATSNSTNFPAVTSVLSAGDELPGITWTSDKVGWTWICAQFRSGAGTTGATAGFRFVDGSANVLINKGINEPASGGLPMNLCAPYYVSSVGATQTIKIQIAASSGSADIQANSTYFNTIWWSVHYGGPQTPTPYVVNSVVNSSTGVTGIQAALINCDSGSAITSQLGSWVSSVGNISSGNCTVTLTSGVFSATPYCWIGPQELNTAVLGYKVVSSSSTTVNVDCEVEGAADCSAFNFNLFCMGAK